MQNEFFKKLQLCFCHDPTLDSLNLFYKRVYFYFLLKIQKNIKYKIQKCFRNMRKQAFELQKTKIIEELIQSKDLIKLLTGLIDLLNDLIEEKFSLKVN
jgi:hypothetical protein